MKAHFGDLAACAGLSTLLFILRWGQLQTVYSPFTRYFRAEPPAATLFLATLLDTLLAASAFWGACAAVRKCHNAVLARIGRGLFLLVLGAAPGITMVAAATPLPARWIVATGRVWFGICTAAAALAIAGKTGRLFRFARGLTMMLAPLLLVFSLSTAVSQWGASSIQYAGAFQGPSVLDTDGWRAKAPILLLVYDELDARLAFTNRPPSIDLPNFDRLRRESVWVDEAYPAARCTAVSVPRLITGLSGLHPEAGDRAIQIGRVQLPEHWGRVPNLFTEARKTGRRTALVGYYHPYCRVLAGSLDFCWSAASADASPSIRLLEYCSEKGILSCAAHQFARLAAEATPRFGRTGDRDLRGEYEVLRRGALRKYLAAREHLLKVLAGGSYDVIFAHLPIPHPPGIYDRRTHLTALDERSNYFDNLELADQLLGEIRASMEKSDTWDVAAVIVTSDHGLRPPVWSYRTTWTAEEKAATHGVETVRVPLMIKLPGLRRSSQFVLPLNTLIIEKLTVELFQERLHGSDALRDWLERNTDRTWVNELGVCP